MLTVRTSVGKALTAEEEERLLAACGTRRSRSIHLIVTLALHPGLRRGEIQSLRWQQVDFLDRTVTVGASKTEAGQGRVVPLNDRALTTLQVWATNFAGRKADHYVFPSEHYGLAGDDRKVHAKILDATRPTREVKTAWKSAKLAAKVRCRFHDLRHTACTRLLERGAPLPVVAVILGWSAGTTAKMAKRYGHIGTDTQRVAVASLDGWLIRRATTKAEGEGSTTGDGNS
jgi:integrase